MLTAEYFFLLLYYGISVSVATRGFSRLANFCVANPRKQVLAKAFRFASSSPQRRIWPQVCRVQLARDAVPLHPTGQCSSQCAGCSWAEGGNCISRTPLLEYKAGIQKGSESPDLCFIHTILCDD